MAEHEPSAGKGGEVHAGAGHESFGGEARARDEDAVSGEPVGEGEGVGGPRRQDATGGGVVQDDREGAVGLVEVTEGGAEGVDAVAGVALVGGVVAREERVGGDTLGDAREDEGVALHHLEGGERVGDDVEGAALRGARALGRGGEREEGVGGEPGGREGEGRVGRVSRGRRRVSRGERVFRGNAACEPSSERRRRARGRSSSARRRVDAPRVTRGIAPRGSGRARGDEARRVCRWDGVGRRGTHLASFASASKRLGGATTANAGVGAACASAARAPGATYAAFFSAMHMVFEGLFRRSDDEARGDVGLGCGGMSTRNTRVERFATWPPNAGVQFPSRSVRPGLAPQNTSTKSDRVETALHQKLRFRRFRVSKHKPLEKSLESRKTVVQ